MEEINSNESVSSRAFMWLTRPASQNRTWLHISQLQRSPWLGGNVWHFLHALLSFARSILAASKCSATLYINASTASDHTLGTPNRNMKAYQTLLDAITKTFFGLMLGSFAKKELTIKQLLWKYIVIKPDKRTCLMHLVLNNNGSNTVCFGLIQEICIRDKTIPL